GQFHAAGDARVYEAMGGPEASVALQDTVHALALLDALGTGPSITAALIPPGWKSLGPSDAAIAGLAEDAAEDVADRLLEAGLTKTGALADLVIETGYNFVIPGNAEAAAELLFEDLGIGLDVPGFGEALLVMDITFYLEHID